MTCPSLSELPSPPKEKSGWPWTHESDHLTDKQSDRGRPWPRISIVTPSYNQGRYLEETIRSVLLQNYPNMEYIVIDGGSTDNTVEIIKKYEKWINCWVSERDDGQSDAIIKGFLRSTGTWINWLNSDDVLKEYALHRLAQYLRLNPQCQFVTGDSEVANKDLSNIGCRLRPNTYSQIDLLEYFNGKYLPQPSVFYSRAAYDNAGGLSKTYHYCMDLDLWLRLRSQYELHYLPECLSVIRNHEDAKTWKYNSRALEEAKEIIMHYIKKNDVMKRLRCLYSFKRAGANGICSFGYHEYFNGFYNRCFKHLWLAFIKCPTIIFSRYWLGLAARMLFPKKIKKIIFKRP